MVVLHKSSIKKLGKKLGFVQAFLVLANVDNSQLEGTHRSWVKDVDLFRPSQCLQHVDNS